MKDCKAKGRIVRFKPNRKFGADNNRAKLTDFLVQMIRLEYSHGATLTQLSKAYGVSLSTVTDVVRRRTWVGVPDIDLRATASQGPTGPNVTR